MLSKLLEMDFEMRLFLAAKRSSTHALVLCLSVCLSVRFKTEFLIVMRCITAYDNV